MAGERRGVFFKVRLFVLLGALATVVLYAFGDVRRREGRKRWDRTLEVAVVLVATAPLDPVAVTNLRARGPVLERRLAEEAARHRPGIDAPFRFRFVGPVASSARAPTLEGDGLGALASHAYALRRYTSAIDDATFEDLGSFDARIYVALSARTSPDRAWIEGESERGGRIGTVRVELDDTMVDLALAVIAHETLHVLGASDKYGADGIAVAPEGLVEPSRVPLYPQPRGEVMARGRPIAAGRQEIVDRLEDLGVGAVTAREIGWLR